MFRYLTAGESHGRALLGVMEGLPAGLRLSVGCVERQLRRRRWGVGRSERQKLETDEVEVLGGLRHGFTLGSPVALKIDNRDWENWAAIMDAFEAPRQAEREVFVPRPGHADYVGGLKYNQFDLRNVLERASARETAMRTALGAVAKVFLEALGVRCGSCVREIGGVGDESVLPASVERLNAKADASVVRCLDSQAEEKMVAVIKAAEAAGETLGGLFEVCVENLPVGLGSYSQWDRRLEGKLAAAVLSINAIKSFQVGLGFSSVFGSEAHDSLFPASKAGLACYSGNRSGGLEGGMSTGQPLVLRASMKPLATLKRGLASLNLRTGKACQAHYERSDVCAVPAASVVGEAVVALQLTEAVLEKFGGDSMEETCARVSAWRERTESA